MRIVRPNGKVIDELKPHGGPRKLKLIDHPFTSVHTSCGYRLVSLPETSNWRCHREQDSTHTARLATRCLCQM